MKNYDNLKLENQLCFALYSATNAVTKSYRAKLKEYGLTYTQYLVLIVLWECDGLRINTLSRVLRLDTGTLTPLLKRLESSGMVNRERNDRDERMMNVYLTKKAKDIKPKIAELQSKVAKETQLTEKQFKSLKTGLDKLTETMQAAYAT